jgi:hypothetical protein
MFIDIQWTAHGQVPVQLQLRFVGTVMDWINAANPGFRINEL